MASGRVGGEGGGADLSAEQVRRIEENRKRAQERLAVRRGVGAHQTGGLDSRVISQSTPRGGPNFKPPPSSGPPPATITRHLTDAVSTAVRTNSHDSAASSSAGFYSRSTSKPTPPPFSQGRIPGPGTTCHAPFDSSTSHSQSFRGDKQARFAPPPSHPASTPSTFQRETGAAESGGSSSTDGSGQLTLVALKKRINANFMLVSRTRFKAVVPYDLTLIEVFKKIPSRNYDAKTASWSFGVEDYNTLVGVVKKECRHVQLSLVPRPVITLFLSLLPSHSSEGRGPSGTLARGGGRGSCRDIDWSRIEPKLASSLMQFQREGVEFCIQRGGCVLIADDMGLGKTLQAMAVMTYYRSSWPLLVVCPSSVRLTWAEAFKQWLPSLAHEDINVILTSKSAAANGLVNIISYDLLVRMSQAIQERRFKAVIADESHFLKNHKTARCKTGLPILKAASHALLLSGTPALSRPIELYTQISALDKSFRVSLVEFGQRYCDGVKSHFGWDFSGASNMAELQLYMEEKVMIRRMKCDVLDQLPSKQRQMVLLAPSHTTAKAREWKELQKELDRAGSLKALKRKEALLPLFEKTGRIKIPAVRDYLLDLLEGGRKVIVFGHHRSVLDSIAECLDSKNIRYIRIDGRTPADIRQSLCDQFQFVDDCLVAVLSITTANAGLTLTAASTVVFAELFWNPGILVQAEDRAYRIGQKNSVNIHYLVAKDTADDFIWPLVQCKLDVLNRAGLAKDDFSSAYSTVLKGSTDSQRNLLQCFDELMEDTDLEQLQSSEGEEISSSSSASSSLPLDSGNAGFIKPTGNPKREREVGASSVTGPAAKRLQARVASDSGACDVRMGIAHYFSTSGGSTKTEQAPTGSKELRLAGKGLPEGASIAVESASQLSDCYSDKPKHGKPGTSEDAACSSSSTCSDRYPVSGREGLCCVSAPQDVREEDQLVQSSSVDVSLPLCGVREGAGSVHVAVPEAPTLDESDYLFSELDSREFDCFDDF